MQMYSPEIDSKLTVTWVLDFLFFGLSFLTLVSIIRGCFAHSNPGVKSFINSVLFLTTITLFIPKFEKFLIEIFVRAMNTKIAQSFLFFFLWLEQICFLHIIIAACLYIPPA